MNQVQLNRYEVISRANLGLQAAESLGLSGRLIQRLQNTTKKRTVLKTILYLVDKREQVLIETGFNASYCGGP